VKGATGIILAVFLGALAMMFNYAYLNSELSNIKTVSLVGIAPGMHLEPGEPLREDQLQEVRVPSANAGSLQQAAYLYEDRKSIIGMKATRAYDAGDIILRRDYRTPPAELKLAQDQRLIWIPVDSRSFVPELVNPGDDVTFIVPTVSVGSRPANVDPDTGEETEPTAPRVAPSSQPQVTLGPDDQFGPFRVGSVGSRLASNAVAQAVKATTFQDRQIGIVVRVDPRTQRLSDKEGAVLKLLEKLQRNDYRHVSIILHPRQPEAP
jgi:hypothetical protein